MSKPFNAPVGGESHKIEDVELIPEGFQLSTFIRLIDVGTHMTNFGEKRQIKLTYEFPQHMRKFYEDKDLQPATISLTETLSFAPKSNLRKLVHGMFRTMTDQEAGVFDLSSLISRHYVATVEHNYSTKHQKTFANIKSIQKLDDRMKAFLGVDSDIAKSINTCLVFSIDNDGFDSDAFANLYGWEQDLLKTSAEGKAWAQQGGRFKETPTGSTNGIPNQSPQQAFGNNSASKHGIVMLTNDYTVEEMLNNGWTIDLLVSEGYAKRVAPQLPPKPAMPSPNSPAPPLPQTPQTPASAPTPQPTPAPVQQQPAPIPAPLPSNVGNPMHDGLIIENNGKLEDWLKLGWTVENMLAGGHAWYLNPDGTKSDVPF